VNDPSPAAPPKCENRHICSCTQRTGCPFGHPFFGPNPAPPEFTEELVPATTPPAATTMDITYRTRSAQYWEFDEAATVPAPHNELTTVLADLERP
jgi:hypothetical protein